MTCFILGIPFLLFLMHVVEGHVFLPRSWQHIMYQGVCADTLDKSRRRDTTFPQSLELQAYHSDCLWLAVSHVFSNLEKTSVKIYTRSRVVTPS